MCPHPNAYPNATVHRTAANAGGQRIPPAGDRVGGGARWSRGRSRTSAARRERRTFELRRRSDPFRANRQGRGHARTSGRSAWVGSRADPETPTERLRRAGSRSAACPPPPPRRWRRPAPPPHTRIARTDRHKGAEAARAGRDCPTRRHGRGGGRYVLDSSCLLSKPMRQRLLGKYSVGG